MSRWVPFLFAVFLPFFFLTSFSQTVYAFDHSLYDQFLKERANNLLNRYLASFNSISWNEVVSFSREDQLAFWINAYNALVLSQEARLALRDRSFTAVQIRDEILRRRFRDERVHFALKDTPVNGPRLRPEVYEGRRLDQQLDEEIRQFLQDPFKNRIQPGEKKVILSYIFKEFGDDFLLNYASPESRSKKFTLSQMAVLSFIVQHSSPDIVKYLEEAKYQIVYFPRSESPQGHLN